MAEIYDRRTSALYGDLQNEETTAQAALTFRSLVDQIELVPEGSDLQIVLSGDLVVILRFAANEETPGLFPEAGVLIDSAIAGSVVCGDALQSIPYGFRDHHDPDPFSAIARGRESDRAVSSI